MTKALTPAADGIVAALLTPVAKATDEPPLLALAVGTLALGTMLRKPAMTRTGARMLASHLLATGMKTVLKASVDRTRPNAEDRGAHLAKGSGTDDTDRNAFPSGHTAGAMAVARSVAHDVPAAAVPVQLAAGAAGAAQVPRGAHHATDVAAGAAIGWLSERLASWAIGTVDRYVEKRAEVRAEAEAEVEAGAHPS
ncbi:phosphatase PAP2 family protein [Sphingomonas adhaesiva]|uniref:phosphatase PAP2 family protein n=1 Tax=Sphingomonas adhaesiva TaxID=28212 RepID=UPI002FF7DCED